MFVTADTIVPNFADPQSLNRYMYCRNNPLVYTDPSGHFFGFFIGAIIGAISSGIQSHWDPGAMLTGAFIGGISGGVYSGVNSAVASTIQSSITNSTIAGAISGAAGGAAAGATAGGLGSAFYGGNIGQGMLRGIGLGAAGGAAFGALGGHYGNTWNMSRVGASALAGGGISELSGQGFEKGAMFAGAAAFGRFMYNKLVLYDANWNPGGNAVEKYPGTYPCEGANNIGTQGGSISPGGWWNEGGRVSRFANYIPGINAVSGLHDVFQINLDQWGGSMARNIFNVPGMLPAAGITYAALMTDMSAVVIYNSISNRDLAR